MHAWWLKWYDWMNDSNRLMIHAHDRLHARDDINAYECCIMWLMFYHANDRMHVCYCRCLLLVFTCFNDLEICNKTGHDWITWKRLKLELKWLSVRKTRRGLHWARRGIRDRNFEIDELGESAVRPTRGAVRLTMFRNEELSVMETAARLPMGAARFSDRMLDLFNLVRYDLLDWIIWWCDVFTIVLPIRLTVVSY